MSNLPLSVWKNPYRIIMGECCDHSSAFNFKMDLLHSCIHLGQLLKLGLV